MEPGGEELAPCCRFGSEGVGSGAQHLQAFAMRSAPAGSVSSLGHTQIPKCLPNVPKGSYIGSSFRLGAIGKRAGAGVGARATNGRCHVIPMHSWFTDRHIPQSDSPGCLSALVRECECGRVWDCVWGVSLLVNRCLENHV